MSKETVREDVVTELLARVGEIRLLYLMMQNSDILKSDVEVPNVNLRISWESEGEDREAVVYFDDEPRRLVYVPGFDWMWYNADGVEE